MFRRDLNIFIGILTIIIKVDWKTDYTSLKKGIRLCLIGNNLFTI